MANPTEALVAGAEQFLAELTDEQFVELVKRVRAPKETGEAADYPSSWGFKGKEGEK